MGKGKEEVKVFLPDTNIFIQAFSGQKKENSFLQKAIKDNNLTISVVVIAEFLAKATEKSEQKFLMLLDSFNILPIDKEVAKVAAEYRRETIKTKRTHILDCFLAAQAKLNKLVLVTNDKSDFPMTDIKVTTP